MTGSTELGAAGAGAPPAAPKRPNIAGITWRLIRRGRPYLGRILLTLAVVLAASGAKAAQGYLIKPVIDELGRDPSVVRPEGPAKPKMWNPFREAFEPIQKLINPRGWDLKVVGLIAIGLSVQLFVFGYLRDTMTNYLTQRIMADLRNDVAGHLLYLPLRYHYDRKSGDLITRVTNDVNLTESAANFYFDDAVVHPLMILCALVLVFVTNAELAFWSVIFFPIYVIPLTYLGRRMRRARKRSLEHRGDMTGTMVQTFGGIKTVKAFNMEEAQAREFREHNESYFRRFMSALRRKALGENLSQLFIGIAVTIMLVGGGALLSKGKVEASDMAVFAMGIAFINTSVRELSKSFNRLVEASAGAERVFELLDQPRETEHGQGAEVPAAGDGVEFSGVSFAYNSAPVLEDVSLKVRPGEMVAVVGRSGAGKTTLVDLLCRFYDPQKGAVGVNGLDLRRARRSSLLSRIAVVTQETFLFNTSIGENIRYGKRDAARAEVEAAAKAAHIHDFIAGLEKGYDTVVGERGAKLSGGQRQRVAIARAILRDPAILILDEATSALDTESERAVQAALEGLIRSERRITFVIAHRLSTVKSATRIVVLDEGRIAEQGTHDELLAREGAYASLYRSQLLS